jgi:hypothetical protein
MSTKKTLNRVLAIFFAIGLMLPDFGVAAAPHPMQTATQAAVRLSDALLNRLPPDWREKVGAVLTLTEERQQRLLAFGDEDLRAGLATDLAASSKPEAMEFILLQLEKEPSAKVRLAMINGWPAQAHWRSNPKTHPVLEKLTALDPDAGVSLRALEISRLFRLRALRANLARRIAEAKSKNDQAGLKLLGEEEERWISLERGVMLPAFMRKVPPQFSVKAADQSVRFLAFGDYGTGRPEQKQTAEAMLAQHQKKPFDFGLTLGDNFYGRGMESTSDPRWQTQWEALYGPLAIQYYATLGNHDWGQPDSPAAEILYADKSRTWRMPAPYYTFAAGSVQFFALDTNEISEAQLMWLTDELSKSKARWKIVYGHHHIYSATRGDNKPMIERLLPILKGRADVYLCGHDHNLQHVRPEGGVHFFVSGGGGAGTYATKEYERTIFRKDTYGFGVVEVDQTQLKVSFVDLKGEQVYEYAIKK